MYGTNWTIPWSVYDAWEVLVDGTLIPLADAYHVVQFFAAVGLCLWLAMFIDSFRKG